ncbi:MAG: CrcB family protein [Acidimicrobiales bacterium]
MVARSTAPAWIALGGLAGAGTRWVIVEAAPDSEMPWAVLAVNLAGSLLLGAVIAAWVARPTGEGPHLRLAVTTGFCGALTTFSTLAVDLADRIRSDEWGTALIWGLGSIAAGVAAAIVGAAATRAVPALRREPPATAGPAT